MNMEIRPAKILTIEGYFAWDNDCGQTFWHKNGEPSHAEFLFGDLVEDNTPCRVTIIIEELSNDDS